jgi:hypothetical protein
MVSVCLGIAIDQFYVEIHSLLPGGLVSRPPEEAIAFIGLIRKD